MWSSGHNGSEHAPGALGKRWGRVLSDLLLRLELLGAGSVSLSD